MAELNTNAFDLKQVMAFFGMTSQEMSREWKRLDARDKVEIRNGLGDRSLTYFRPEDKPSD